MDTEYELFETPPKSINVFNISNNINITIDMNDKKTNTNICYTCKNICKNICDYISISKKTKTVMIEKLMIYITHLTLISLFEIVFYFKIVSIYENVAIIDIINNFFVRVPEYCSSLNPVEKHYFIDEFNKIINTSTLFENSIISKNDRITFNNKLFFIAWMYFIAIFIINIFLFIINVYYTLNISLKKILLDNILMISILAIYEYIFFRTIILLYKNISMDELENNIVNNFYSCLH